jgi:TonB-dependent starch-binding outer membrane protein SusC
MSKLTGFFIKHACLSFLFLSSSFFATAQKDISGNVTDNTGNPIQKASVTVKGTNTGTLTDAEGNYRFTIPADAKILVFSFINMVPQEVAIGNQTTINISLKQSESILGEVVVVGYGTQQRTEVTGAISTVNSKTISELPVASIQQALQGRVTGLQVTNNGSPGTEPLVRIRGISSISFASNPLYVIDGFPTGDLSMFDTKMLLLQLFMVQEPPVV